MNGIKAIVKIWSGFVEGLDRMATPVASSVPLKSPTAVSPTSRRLEHTYKLGIEFISQ